ncbi:MAG: universal stress protein [Deltaproteobacteria bacterium]|nr:universal stress protein [Deltaproteobacteria bacterium]
MEYRCILCPTDGSELSQKSGDIAAYLSKLSGARLILLHVMQKWHHYRSDLLITDSAEWEAIHKDWLKEGQELLDREEERLKKKGSGYIKQELKDGEAAYEIVTVAHEQHADLIVMATHRASLIEKLFSDSISYHVTKNTPCPILWVY